MDCVRPSPRLVLGMPCENDDSCSWKAQYEKERSLRNLMRDNYDMMLAKLNNYDEMTTQLRQAHADLDELKCTYAKDREFWSVQKSQMESIQTALRDKLAREKGLLAESTERFKSAASNAARYSVELLQAQHRIKNLENSESMVDSRMREVSAARVSAQCVDVAVQSESVAAWLKQNDALKEKVAVLESAHISLHDQLEKLMDAKRNCTLTYDVGTLVRAVTAEKDIQTEVDDPPVLVSTGIQVRMKAIREGRLSRNANVKGCGVSGNGEASIEAVSPIKQHRLATEEKEKEIETGKEKKKENEKNKEKEGDIQPSILVHEEDSAAEISPVTLGTDAWQVIIPSVEAQWQSDILPQLAAMIEKSGDIDISLPDRFQTIFQLIEGSNADRVILFCAQQADFSLEDWLSFLTAWWIRPHQALKEPLLTRYVCRLVFEVAPAAKSRWLHLCWQEECDRSRYELLQKYRGEKYLVYRERRKLFVSMLSPRQAEAFLLDACLARSITACDICLLVGSAPSLRKISSHSAPWKLVFTLLVWNSFLDSYEVAPVRWLSVYFQLPPCASQTQAEELLQSLACVAAKEPNIALARLSSVLFHQWLGPAWMANHWKGYLPYEYQQRAAELPQICATYFTASERSKQKKRKLS